MTRDAEWRCVEFGRLTRRLERPPRSVTRPTPAAGARKVFYAEHHAVTAIDPSQLVIVAFVQDSNQNVLQAVQADVVMKRP